jgi:hypothetical protein
MFDEQSAIWSGYKSEILFCFHGGPVTTKRPSRGSIPATPAGQSNLRMVGANAKSQQRRRAQLHEKAAERAGVQIGECHENGKNFCVFLSRLQRSGRAGWHRHKAS